MADYLLTLKPNTGSEAWGPLVTIRTSQPRNISASVISNKKPNGDSPRVHVRLNEFPSVGEQLTGIREAGPAALGMEAPMEPFQPIAAVSRV